MIRERRRHVLLLVASAVAALAVAAWVGVSAYGSVDRTPKRPVVEGRLGEPVETSGVQVTVERVEVARSFPSVRSGQDPVTAREGAQLVKVTYRIVNQGLPEGSYYCDERLLQHPGEPGQREWRADTTMGFDLNSGDAIGCRPPEGTPADTPVRVVVAFEVPAAAAQDIVVRVGTTEDRPWVQVRP